MTLDEIAIAVLKKYATKSKPIHAKELHYLAEQMFSSEDYNPKRAAGYSPEKSIQSKVGKLAERNMLSVKRVKQKEGDEHERYYYYLEEPFGNGMVKLEDGTVVRAVVIDID